MTLLTDQTDLLVQLKTIFDNKNIVLKSLKGYEALSELFEFHIVFASKSSSLNIEQALKSEITVTLKASDRKRYINGIIAEFWQGATNYENDLYMTEYEAIIRPRLWLLTLDKNFLIFQNKKIIDIIKDVLKSTGIKDVEYKTRLSGNTLRDYCVQYGESSFNFISRLMEDEGIFYFFKHTDGKHTLVLADSDSVYNSVDGDSKVEFLKNSNSTFRLGYIFNTSLRTSVNTGGYSLADYNYTISQTKLFKKVDSKWKGNMFYDYPGGFEQLKEGETFAKLRIEAFEFDHAMLKASSSVFSFIPGATFKLDGHHAKNFNAEYTLYKVEHYFNFSDDQGFIYKNNFEAFPRKIIFRPIRKTPKPKIFGTQTAVVTTSSEKEEVLRDKFCSVKVHFHWDQVGKDKNNKESSCWVRVGQLFAGNGWGSVFLPRVGQEVIVSFVDGDPDRPLIVGALYNDKFIPPYSEKNPMISTIKTTHIEADKKRGFNEMRITDVKDKEEFYFHAHKDMVIEIVNERKTTIEDSNDTLELLQGSRFITLSAKGDGPANHSVILQKGNSSIELKEGNRSIKLLKGAQDTNISKDCSLTVGGNLTIKVSGNVSVECTDYSLNASGNIAVKAGGNITMKAGGNFSLNASGNISEKAGVNTTIEAGAAAKYKSSAITEISAGATATVKGMGVKIDAGIGPLKGTGLSAELTGSTTAKITGLAGVDITAGGSLNAKGAMISLAGAMVKLG